MATCAESDRDLWGNCIENMGLRRPTTLWASTVCYRDRFTIYLYLYDTHLPGCSCSYACYYVGTEFFWVIIFMPRELCPQIKNPGAHWWRLDGPHIQSSRCRGEKILAPTRTRTLIPRSCNPEAGRNTDRAIPALLCLLNRIIWEDGPAGHE
jgi:hypothetical protein